MADGSVGWRWLAHFRRLNQCESAGDDLALNRLALARNGCGLQVYKLHYCGSCSPCIKRATFVFPITLANMDRFCFVVKTRTATRSCRTRKQAFHFCSPGVVRRSHAAADGVAAAAPPLPLLLVLLCVGKLMIKN